jgi:hypothetical protein
LQAQQKKFTLDINSYHIIRWDPKVQGEDDLRKMLADSLKKGAKRVAIIVKSDDVDYMIKAREVIAGFIAQTIVIFREKEVEIA